MPRRANQKKRERSKGQPTAVVVWATHIRAYAWVWVVLRMYVSSTSRVLGLSEIISAIPFFSSRRTENRRTCHKDVWEKQAGVVSRNGTITNDFIGFGFSSKGHRRHSLKKSKGLIATPCFPGGPQAMKEIDSSTSQQLPHPTIVALLHWYRPTSMQYRKRSNHKTSR